MTLTKTAAALMLLTLAAHMFGGGPDIHDPLYAVAPTAELKAYTSIIWHMISLVAASFFCALLWISFHPNRPMALFLSVTQLGFAALFITYGQIHVGNIWQLPQWTVFILIPALTMWGQNKTPA